MLKYQYKTKLAILIQTNYKNKINWNLNFKYKIFPNKYLYLILSILINFFFKYYNVNQNFLQLNFYLNDLIIYY